MAIPEFHYYFLFFAVLFGHNVYMVPHEANIEVDIKAKTVTIDYQDLYCDSCHTGEVDSILQVIENAPMNWPEPIYLKIGLLNKQINHNGTQKNAKFTFSYQSFKTLSDDFFLYRGEDGRYILPHFQYETVTRHNGTLTPTIYGSEDMDITWKPGTEKLKFSLQLSPKISIDRAGEVIILE